MVIKVIGMGCENCDKLYENVMEAVKETGSDAVVEKVGDLMEIVKLGVMAAPSLMIDGKLVESDPGPDPRHEMAEGRGRSGPYGHGNRYFLQTWRQRTFFYL